MAIIIGASVGVVYYTSFYLPESLLKPLVDEAILKPIKTAVIEIIEGSSGSDQQNNFMPKHANIQLGIDNYVFWKNLDVTAHTVTPDIVTEDSYSGKFGSPGVIKPGAQYEFLFTEDAVIEYHCEPHPWMKGKLEITKQRF